VKWIGTQTIYDHVRLNKGITIDSVPISTIQTSSESFADNDTSLMTSAAIADKIEAYGYSTTTGDITGVDLTGSLPITINSETGTTSGNYSATIAIDAATTSAKGVVELATTAETTTGTDTNRVVTCDGLKDGYQGSTNVTTLGTITTGTWQGTAINQTYLTGQSGTNTGDETLASINALDITEVGTIDSGVWQGTAIASAYLDADTAHYSATRQLTHHGISDDIDSDVVYISLLESDAENTSAANKHLPIIAPAAGKLLKIFVRTTVDQSSETFTWKLYTRTTSQSTNGAAAEIGAQSGAGPNNKTMVTYDFTTGLDSGTNVIGAGDKVQISLQAGDGSTSNGGYFITCLWEWNLS
tara:strand:- start:803 stop:1873 length:1071 start_codon:yes stop_codon:yes gene_type:complete